jgi:hypothetical protein
MEHAAVRVGVGVVRRLGHRDRLVDDAGPVNGNVPPIVIWLFETPGVVVCEAAAALAMAAVARRAQTSAPSVLRLTPMGAPSDFGLCR